MGKKTKIWLIAAGASVLIGCIILGVTMTILGWDFSRLSTVKYETNQYEISENFENIWIDTDTTKVVFTPSEDGKIRVVCHEPNRVKHTVAVNNGTLRITTDDSRKWYHNIGIVFSSPSITVYLPQGLYGTLVVKSDTGSVEIPGGFEFTSVNVDVVTGHIRLTDVTAGEVRLAVNTGKVHLTGVRCKRLVSDGDTGDILLENVIATERFEIERDTGDVVFDRCDAGEIFVETDTGDVTGSLLSDKVFITETDTGRIMVPKTVSGGRCEISTDTGNILITIAK